MQEARNLTNAERYVNSPITYSSFSTSPCLVQLTVWSSVALLSVNTESRTLPGVKVKNLYNVLVL